MASAFVCRRPGRCSILKSYSARSCSHLCPTGSLKLTNHLRVPFIVYLQKASSVTGTAAIPVIPTTQMSWLKIVCFSISVFVCLLVGWGVCLLVGLSVCLSDRLFVVLGLSLGYLLDILLWCMFCCVAWSVGPNLWWNNSVEFALTPMYLIILVFPVCCRTHCSQCTIQKTAISAISTSEASSLDCRGDSFCWTSYLANATSKYPALWHCIPELGGTLKTFVEIQWSAINNKVYFILSYPLFNPRRNAGGFASQMNSDEFLSQKCTPVWNYVTQAVFLWTALISSLFILQYVKKGCPTPTSVWPSQMKCLCLLSSPR